MKNEYKKISSSDHILDGYNFAKNMFDLNAFL